ILNRELGSSARALLSVALSTGARNVISSESIGLGEMPWTPSAVAVDSAAGMAYVVDSTGGVITVNLSTGDKTPLADKPKDHISNGSEKDIALDVANQRLLVTDTDRHKVWAIDTQTGDRSV